MCGKIRKLERSTGTYSLLSQKQGIEIEALRAENDKLAHTNQGLKDQLKNTEELKMEYKNVLHS